MMILLYIPHATFHKHLLWKYHGNTSWSWYPTVDKMFVASLVKDCLANLMLHVAKRHNSFSACKTWDGTWGIYHCLSIPQENHLQVHDFKPKSSTSVLHCHQRFPTFTYFTMDGNNILLKWPLPPHNMYPRKISPDPSGIWSISAKTSSGVSFRGFSDSWMPSLGLCAPVCFPQGNMWKEQKIKVNPIFEHHSHKPLLLFLACWYSSTENFWKYSLKLFE